MTLIEDVTTEVNTMASVTVAREVGQSILQWHHTERAPGWWVPSLGKEPRPISVGWDYEPDDPGRTHFLPFWDPCHNIAGAVLLADTMNRHRGWDIKQEVYTALINRPNVGQVYDVQIICAHSRRGKYTQTVEVSPLTNALADVVANTLTRCCLIAFKCGQHFE